MENLHNLQALTGHPISNSVGDSMAPLKGDHQRMCSICEKLDVLTTLIGPIKGTGYEYCKPEELWQTHSQYAEQGDGEGAPIHLMFTLKTDA